MFEALHFGDQFLALLLIAVLGITTWSAARLAPRRTLGALRRVALATLVMIGLAVALIALRLVIVSSLWAGFGWAVAADRALIGAPLLALPLLAMLALSVPRLRQLARVAKGARN